MTNINIGDLLNRFNISLAFEIPTVGGCIYTFSVRRRTEVEDRELSMGYAILHEPSGDCAVVLGSFPLGEFVDAIVAGNNNVVYATSFSPVGGGEEADTVRPILRRVVEESANHDVHEYAIIEADK